MMLRRSHAARFLLPLAMLAAFAAAASAQTVPLTRYQNKHGVAAYAALPEHRKLYEANPSVWKVFGVVGHCYASKQPGTAPVLNLKRPTKFGDQHFYTTDVDEAISVQNSSATWVADDVKVLCFAATSKLAGTVPAYRYRQPSGRDYIYAFGDGENNLLKQSPELKFESVAFFVWAQPGGMVKSSPFPDPAPQKPDLAVGNVGVMPNGKVIFAVRNNGFAINQRPFDVRLTAYGPGGQVLWSRDKTVAPVIAKGSYAEQSVEPPADKTLHGVRIKVTVDAGGVIEETDEGNNTSDFVNGLPELNFPGPVVKVPSPTRPLPASAPDLKLRAALYANGADASRLNTAARYATPGRPLTLKKSEAVRCDGEVCTFNLGFIAQRAAAGGEVRTYALLRGDTFGVVGNTVVFAAGEGSKPVVHAVRLKAGENRVTVEIDPERQAGDPNPSNNSFEVTIVVEP
jgi:hypothetical protein